MDEDDIAFMEVIDMADEEIAKRAGCSVRTLKRRRQEKGEKKKKYDSHTLEEVVEVSGHHCNPRTDRFSCQIVRAVLDLIGRESGETPVVSRVKALGHVIRRSDIRAALTCHQAGKAQSMAASRRQTRLHGAV